MHPEIRALIDAASEPYLVAGKLFANALAWATAPAIGKA
jgi:hypothetical protein